MNAKNIIYWWKKARVKRHFEASDLSKIVVESAVAVSRYSNFVNFPIYLNGNRINTVEDVWAMEPNSVDDEMHNQFYKYIAKAFNTPLTKLHFHMNGMGWNR
jgi:TNF receptor-associated protein 1